MIRVVPIDNNLSGDLAAFVDSFISANLGEVKAADKAWSVYSQDGETVKILGFCACNIGNRIADVPVYHVLEGETRPEKAESMRAHEALFARVTGFISDMGIREALFYIAPEAQEHWKEFQKKVNGKPAHRFVMEV